ncbi:uncharacterized protein LOC130785665 isoform X1 [Actinidia eriantha]|uniref:uncharacterized protein LOC130785665 isoform X1 n=1 Tax=Actinidia eriantha TaxID=165200 RepID=UPI00258FBDB3|nr:uncharacterized protein LOC130785665 isoform X1 [Actinidia eriantha]
MAHPSDHRLCSSGFVRCGLVLSSLCLVGLILGIPWLLRENSHAQASCPSCDCHCSSDILSTPLDCSINDPEMNEEIEKNTISLLSEELSLLRNVTDGNLKRTEALTMDAKRTSSHYQKEAEKCNAGMETCEGAREKAEAAFVEERKLSALWEKRARELGFTRERRIYLQV